MDKMISEAAATGAIESIMKAWEDAVDLNVTDPELANKIKDSASENILGEMLKIMLDALPNNNL